MNIHLTPLQQVAIFGVSMVTSKGASGISGAGFIALVGTLSVIPSIPLAGMALILGIDRFMSTGRAIVNIVGNAVATVVMASLEGELDRDRMRRVLSGARVEDGEIGAPAEVLAQVGGRAGGGRGNLRMTPQI
jgi:aerobic C4-dicarboxylate transport protein